MNGALFSSSRDDWETPPDFFEKLNAEFRFTLDPCASPETAKCPRYFTPEDDGLSRPWDAPGGGAVFCNPPYSRRGKDKPGQEDWIKKAAEEGSRPGAVVVMLIPARTDTLAFHEYIYHKAEIRFIKGRLRFRVDGKAGDAAPFPSISHSDITPSAPILETTRPHMSAFSCKSTSTPRTALTPSTSAAT